MDEMDENGKEWSQCYESMRWDDREMNECMIWSRQQKNRVDVLIIATIVVHKRSSTWG